MTKTEDQRIVEITTAKKFVSKSTMSLLKDKLYKRKRSGFYLVVIMHKCFYIL